MDILTLLANWAQIIGLPIAIIAIAVSIWLYRRGKYKRAITCVFDSVVSPVEIRAGEALKGEIEIRYKGKTVSNLLVVRAHLMNVGSLPIRKSDVIEPIKFTFAENTELIRRPSVLDKAPKELNIDWQFDMTGNSPRVKSANLIFDLLNPKDEFTIEFTCTGDNRIPEVTARIEGMPQVDVIGPSEVFLLEHTAHLFSIWGIVTLTVLCGGMLLPAAMVINDYRLGNLDLVKVLMSLLLLGLCVTLLWVSVLSPTIELRRLRRRRQKRERV